MGEVIPHFGGNLAPIVCMSSTAYKKCSQASVCRFRRFFLDIRNNISCSMDDATLEAVFKAQPVTREEVFEETLICGAGIWSFSRISSEIARFAAIV